MYPLINVGFGKFFPKNNKRVYTTIRGTRVLTKFGILHTIYLVKMLKINHRKFFLGKIVIVGYRSHQTCLVGPSQQHLIKN